MATLYKVEDSNEVELSLDAVPGWLTKIALPILLILVLGLPLTLHFISYPEVVTADIKIIPSKTSFNLANIPDFKLDVILRKERDSVFQGMVVATGVWSNTGKKDSVRSSVDGVLHMIYDMASEKKVPIVVPTDNSYAVRGAIPIENRKYIDSEQKIFIDLKKFPSEEFGVLVGRINGLSSVPFNSIFTFDVKLESGLLSTENILLEANDVLEGQAKIFTKEKSVLERIINSLSPK